MLLGLVFLIVGIVLLTFAADQFVDGAASLAERFNISSVVVGALVIGFGTSLPEMLVSGVAAVGGDADLGVGNVVGSNVANLTLVLGFAALITVIGAGASTVRRELPLCVVSVCLFAILVQGGLQRWEGIVLAVAMFAALALLLVGGLADGDDSADDSSAADDSNSPATDSASNVKLAGMTLVGLVGTVGGAWLLVEGALAVADGLGLTGGFIGLTMVAIGTSLPEMVTAVVAARKGETELIIGNLLGSNVFNSLAVGAVLGLLGPGPLQDQNLAGIATMIMVGVVLIAALFLLTGGRVVRWQAALLLVIYFATMPFTVSTEDDVEAAAVNDLSLTAVASGDG